ncbi:polysaccharide lyase family 8 super-sandwich domain-containing protein [Pseudonocardia sp. HH130630-07]|uniref:polysaccharide lyase family 8 super-sandwich domain-containing protein n=1 Tax=Pseudonocardia sp. HH130630-07 TaxID=1690815 RepID=UPI0008150442|nr:polysaccharide lyase family 8 super-sandwich domain-containing protein [Pseudonocardia sp. HH130630-07]ANY05272.1 hypothetical protein AFB00_01910 [Pseudonocardia sp. HH130630-07]
MPVPRRTVLSGALVTATVALLGSRLSTATAHAEGPADLVLARRREFLTGAPWMSDDARIVARRDAVDATVAGLLGDIATGSGPVPSGVWPDRPIDRLDSEAQHFVNLQSTADELQSIALAWATEGSVHQGRTEVRDAAVGGLELVARYFTPAEKPEMATVGNWYNREIGAPKAIMDALVLLGAEVPAATRTALLDACRTLVPNPNLRGEDIREVSANRTDKATIAVLRGVLGADPAATESGRAAFSDEEGGGRDDVFAFATSGDGIYADGSLIQHRRLPYVGGYGTVLLSRVAAALWMLQGSEWSLEDADPTVFYDAVDRAFTPFQWDARTMSTTRGRGVSRSDILEIDNGLGLAAAVHLLAESAPAERRTALRATARGWLERTPGLDLGTAGMGVANTARCVDLLTDPELSPAPRLSGTVHTHLQERMVHHGGTWAAVVNTSSTRIGRFEWGNRQNQYGWYQGDGMMFLYTESRHDHYDDGYWPTVDPYAPAGVTANSQELEPHAEEGTSIPAAKNTYAGGTTLGGDSGSTAMDLTNDRGNLSALTSWTYLPGSVVCLGSAITDSSGTEVRTVLENRGYPKGGVPAVQADGTALPAGTGGDPVQARTSVHVAGHAGIVLLARPGGAPEPVRVRIESRSGSWTTIDTLKNSDPTPIERDYVRVERIHGDSGATDAGYAYQILPGADAAATSSAAEAPGVVVVAADARCHLLHDGEGRWFGHFFAPAQAAGFTADRSCSIGVHVGDGATEIAVADPRRATEPVTVTFPFDAPGPVRTPDDRVRVVATAPLTVTVDTGTDPAATRRVVFDGAAALPAP